MSRSMETWFGLVRTPGDAIVIFEACRQNILPRVQRRLSEKERQAIRSGSVFVWDEKEAGMRRWTDGKSWSASRVAGSFLTYREMEGKRGSCERQASGSYKKRGASSESEEKDGDPNALDGYQYKSNGLVKQSFSITNSDGHHLHLISYYSRAHNSMRGSPLMTPSEDPRVRQVKIQKGMYPESTMADIATVHSTSVSPAMTKVQAQQDRSYESPQQSSGQYGYQPHRPISRSPYQQQQPAYDSRPNVTVNTDLTPWRGSATPASAYHTATSDIRPEMVDRTPSSSSAVRNDNSLAPILLTRPSPEPSNTLQLPSLTNRDPSPQAPHSRPPSNSTHEYPYQQSHSSTSTPVIRHTSPFTLPPLQPGFQNQSPHQRQQSTPPRLTPEYSQGQTPPSLPGIASLLNNHPSPSSASTSAYLAPSSATSAPGARLPSLPPTSMSIPMGVGVAGSIDHASLQRQSSSSNTQYSQLPSLNERSRSVGLGVDAGDRSCSVTPGGGVR